MRDQRQQLAERLRARSGEIEDAVLDRIRALEEAGSGPRRLAGLRGLVGPTIEHGLLAVEAGEQNSPEPPPAVIAHARKAAWRSIPTHTLHERYTAGYSVFKSFLLREVGSPELAGEVQRSTDVVFERLIRAAGEEHERELRKRNRSSDVRRLERVQELLSGEILEAPDLQYPFSGTHLGIVGSGPEISSTVHKLFRPLGPNLLLVSPTPRRVWGWIDTQQEISRDDMDELLGRGLPLEICVAVGEPAEGVEGWRLTHQQALTAWSYAARCGSPAVQYANVALVASALGDELLMSSLTRRYLEPLAASRGGGTALRETLRAYFATRGHASSAAKLLGVKRHTVTNRLRTVEERLGCRLDDCASELELALRLEAVG